MHFDTPKKNDSDYETFSWGGGRGEGRGLKTSKLF